MTRAGVAIISGLWAVSLPAQAPPPLPADFADRLASLEQAYAAQPANPKILDALAGSYAMANRYPDAIRIVEQMLLLPGARSDLRLRLAQLYSWSGQSERALAALGALPEPLDAQAAEFRCQVLSASAKAVAAAACYTSLLADHPPDHARWANARLALARNLAWSGRLKAAIENYRIYHAGVPDDRPAAIEWIRLLLQTGSYGKAERVCDYLLLNEPRDAAVLALKAEVLHWSRHRSHAELQLAETALSLDPALPDARVGQVYALGDLGSRRAARQSFGSLQAAVEAAGGVSAEATYAGAYRYLERQFEDAPRLTATTVYSDYQDSDAIRDRMASLRLAAPAGDHLWRLDLDRFTSSAPATSIFSDGAGTAVATRAMAALDLHLAAAISLRLAAGGYAQSGHSGIRPAFRLAWSAEPVDRWAFDVSVARDLVPLTPKTIVQGIANYAARATATHHFDSRNSAWVGLERRIWSDSNRSLAADAVFQRVLRYTRALAMDGGIETHFEAFRHDMFSRSGYFSPDYYERYEGFLSAHGELGRRAQYEVRAQGGEQRLAQGADLRSSWAVSSSLRLRLHRSLGLVSAWQWRNYSLLYQTGWYRQLSVQLEVHP
jgi:predicted Zn-dependent protease